jgi:exonuclease VII small subunit
MDPRDLYGLPLERFTEERNALARQLRQAGRRDDAADVAKLKKPSLSAWAVNQLVRTQKRDVDALCKAGDALQKAQADVLAGRGDGRSLRRAADAERAAVGGLAAKARGLLSSQGHELTPAKLEQVSETLHAAAVDAEARAAVRDGCLVRELRHVGLGQLGAPAAGPQRRRATAKAPRADDRAAKLRSARQDEAAARRALERVQRELEQAQRRHDRAAAGLRKAEHTLEAARDAVDTARRDHERTRRTLEKL